MTKCWSEGELRAYLDRELSTEDMQQVASHLGHCPACDGLCTELAARAAHVSALMELLPEWEAAPQTGPAAARPAVIAMKRPQPQQAWVGIAVAVAAGLAVAAYLMPKPAPQVAIGNPVVNPVVRPVPETPAIETPATTALPALAREVADGPAPRRMRRPRKPAPEQAYFVALDDEPFESGVIMRVDVKPGNMQADIVFGPDGRAHAFRLVNAGNRNTN